MHSLTAKPLGFPPRSPTGCGPRRAAWRRSRAVFPTPSPSKSRFRRPILLPGRVEFAQRQRGRARSTSRCATPSDRHHTSTVAATTGSQSKSEATRCGSRQGAMAERSMGFGLRALNRLAGSDLLDRIRHPQAGRASALQLHQERLPHRDGGRAQLQGGAEAGQTGAPDGGQATRPLRRHPRRRAADAPGRRAATSPRRRCAPPRSRRTPTARRRPSCSTRPTSWASTCSASPRSSAASCRSRPP